MAYIDLPYRRIQSYPTVETYNDLPSAASVNNSIYIVLNTSGIYGFRNLKGFYYSIANSWSYLGDLSPALIKEMYEANADTNAFTDTYKSKVDAASAGEVLVPLFCSLTATAQDLVILSQDSDNTVDSIYSNNYAGLSIGLIHSKTSATECLVQVSGSREGFTGLARGKMVYIGLDGQPTTTPPETGGLQIIGMALSNTRILLDFNKQKVIQS